MTALFCVSVCLCKQKLEMTCAVRGRSTRFMTSKYATVIYFNFMTSMETFKLPILKKKVRALSSS